MPKKCRKTLKAYVRGGWEAEALGEKEKPVFY